MNPSAHNGSDLIRELASRGCYHFSTEQAARELGVSVVAARAVLRRLKAKGAIAAPLRGFHVIVSPENRRLGCLPPEQLIPQLMAHLGSPYYVGLLSAARYHGAAHQQPQIFQVVVPKNRPPLRCGRVAVSFVARHNAVLMPTQSINTPRGYAAISSPEATAFDLVGYPQHCGGLSNVATVLTELAEKLDPEKLVAVAPLSPAPWAQRLGYLLELVEVGEKAQGLADYVAAMVTEAVPLSVVHPLNGTQRSNRWRIRINAEVEADL